MLRTVSKALLWLTWLHILESCTYTYTRTHAHKIYTHALFIREKITHTDTHTVNTSHT